MKSINVLKHIPQAIKKLLTILIMLSLTPNASYAGSITLACATCQTAGPLVAGLSVYKVEETPTEQPLELITVPKSDLETLVDFSKKCNTFANACQERVQLQQAYMTDADTQMKNLTDALDEERNKFRPNLWTIIPISLALGLIGGIVISKKL